MAGWGVIDDFLGMMNWTDWLEGIIRGAAAGDIAGHRITLPSPGSDFWKIRNDKGLEPWSLNDVRRLLESYHITTYRRGFNSEEIWVHVKRKQASWAEYILHRVGAPVIMSTVNPKNATWAARHTTLPPPAGMTSPNQIAAAAVAPPAPTNVGTDKESTGRGVACWGVALCPAHP